MGKLVSLAVRRALVAAAALPLYWRCIFAECLREAQRQTGTWAVPCGPGFVIHASDDGVEVKVAERAVELTAAEARELLEQLENQPIAAGTGGLHG